MYNNNKKYFSIILLLGFVFIACSNNNKPSVTEGTNTESVNKIQPVKPKVLIDTQNVFTGRPIKYDTTKKYIYLTFDDGPQNGTRICYDICKNLNTKATFFMVGEHANSPKTMEMVDTIRQGYPLTLLANHSTSHAKDHYKYFYHHPQEAAEDFYAAQKKLKVPYKIIRLPGNSAWVRAGEVKASGLVKPVCNILDSAGYNVIGWSLEWQFTHDKHCFPKQSVSKMLAMVEEWFQKDYTHNKNHLVILSHDRMFQHQPYSDSLYNFIKALKQNPNYILETVDHYPGLKAK